MYSSAKLLKGILICLFCFILPTNLLAQKQFKALLITETGEWHHESLGSGVAAINELAARHNFQVKRQQNAEKVTENDLKDIDVVIFLSTTANIFDKDEQSAFEKYIQSGKGFVGIHAASDTEYEWEWYTKLVGRMFHIHPDPQTAKISIIDHNFPGLEHFPDTLLWTDEWYEFGEEKMNNLNYLITVNEDSFNPAVIWENKDIDNNGNKIDRIGNGMGKFHPISWYHEFDGGRSFYTALGHIDKVYENQWFLDHLYGGIYYAATGKGAAKK